MSLPCQQEHSTHTELSFHVGGEPSIVLLGKDIVDCCVDLVGQFGPDAICVVTDTTVSGLYRDSLAAKFSTLLRVSVHWVELRPGERSKTLKSVERVLSSALPNLTRSSMFLSFGGGVIANVTGTCAALLYRGVQFAHLPTTLMAQADACIGIKQAVNAGISKNAFGAYHAPRFVVSDINFLRSLPPSELREGLAETVKVLYSRSPEYIAEFEGLMGQFPDFCDQALARIIYFTVLPKVQGIETDPLERNELLYLEIGHTLGHAIERATKGRVRHGEAISYGMRMEAEIARQLGLCQHGFTSRLGHTLDVVGFRNVLPPFIDPNAVLACLKCDNRRNRHGPVFVLPLSEGRTYATSDVPIELVGKIISSTDLRARM